MNQTERRLFLIQELVSEQPRYRNQTIPHDAAKQKDLLRSLMNIREPLPVSEGFLTVQDAYLQEETARKGITRLSDLKQVQQGIYLWQGDITTLNCDAIVNAANAGMTGCYHPLHNCIDNVIHSNAGVELRLACAKLMAEQGKEEKTGKAKITPAFNLPSRFVLHTVGPIIDGAVAKRDEELLASCYRSCLELAEEKHLKSIAFCCISTGEFRFLNDRAAEIALQTVTAYKAETTSQMEVIFNVFKNIDDAIYRTLLRANESTEK